MSEMHEMMNLKNKSAYVLQPDKKTFCPNCFADVVLLCRADGNNRKPWFYICFVCKTVAEVGKGECKWEW